MSELTQQEGRVSTIDIVDRLLAVISRHKQSIAVFQMNYVLNELPDLRMRRNS